MTQPHPVLGREQSSWEGVMVTIKGQLSQSQWWQGDVPSLPLACHSSGHHKALIMVQGDCDSLGHAGDSQTRAWQEFLVPAGQRG